MRAAPLVAAHLGGELGWTKEQAKNAADEYVAKIARQSETLGIPVREPVP
jgi:hypothetical protein